MQTYKITFKLNTPVSFIDTPTLDGLIYYAYVRDYCKNNNKPFEQKLNIDNSDIIDINGMPLLFHEAGYPYASYMYFEHENSIEHIQKWRKRWANKHDKIADFGNQKRKIRINAGEFKSYDMPLRTINVDRVWFFFKSDNVVEVKRLIENWVYFIGKKRSQGYGEIESFLIEESQFNFNEIFRPIPVDIKNGVIGSTIRLAAWKPPYWLPSNFTKCFV